MVLTQRWIYSDTLVGCAAEACNQYYVIKGPKNFLTALESYKPSAISQKTSLSFGITPHKRPLVYLRAKHPHILKEASSKDKCPREWKQVKLALRLLKAICFANKHHCTPFCLLIWRFSGPHQQVPKLQEPPAGASPRAKAWQNSPADTWNETLS